MSVVGGVADAGASPAELLGRAGLAAAALGERELASAPATLQRAMAASGYPWLAANLFDSATGRRPTWSESFRMISAADRRVAVVGYLGESAAALLSAERGEALRVAGGALALKASLDAARAAAPDLTVLLAHAAADEIAQLVRDLPRGSVDLVVAGHGAAPRADSANGVPVIRGSAGGDTLAVADLFVTATGARQVRSSVIPIPADASQDPMLAALVQRALGRRDSALAAPLATLKLPLSAHSAALGRLIAEARRNALRADLGVVSADEIGAGLAAGPVSYRELLRVQPRGRALLLVSATGAELRALFERLVEGGAASAHLAGVEVRYDPERRPGRRVRQVVLPGGGELRHDREYRLAVDETFTETPGRERRDRRGPERSDVLDVDALALYLRRLSQPVEVSGRPSFFSIEP